MFERGLPQRGQPSILEPTLWTSSRQRKPRCGGIAVCGRGVPGQGMGAAHIMAGDWPLPRNTIPGLQPHALQAPKRHRSSGFGVAGWFLFRPLSERPLESLWPNSPGTPERVVQVGDEKEDEHNRTR